MDNASQTIGKYIIERQLGRGDTGPLYLGYDPKLDRRVAIRVYVGFEGEVLQNRFFQEARAIGKLDHPNIVRICDLDLHHNRPYVATEFIEGEDLQTVIEKNLSVPFTQKLQIIAQTCQALHYAHGKGVVHGCLLPGDIRIDSEGKATIIDFDLARRTKQGPGRKPDCANDISGAGAVLYEFIAYIRPDPRDYRSIQEVLPACAPELREILDRAIGSDRDHRFATCLEFVETLQSFGKASGSHANTLIRDVVRLETELDNYARSLAQLNILDFHESSAGRPGSPDERDGTMDYGELLHRHASAQQKLNLLAEKLRAAAPAVQLFQTGYEQFKRGDFENCQRTLQDLLGLCPEHSLAQRLLKACANAIAEDQRRKEYEKRLKLALTQARDAVDRKQYPQAMFIVDRILAIEPSQPDAALLRDAANRSKLAKNS